MSKTTEARWVETYASPDGATVIEDLDGIAWHKAPTPNRWHRCSPQTKGWTNYFSQVFRCACGAISHDARHWSERNGRKG